MIPPESNHITNDVLTKCVEIYHRNKFLPQIVEQIQDEFPSITKKEAELIAWAVDATEWYEK